MSIQLLNQSFPSASKIKEILVASYAAYTLIFPSCNKEHIRKAVNKVIACRTEVSGCRVYKCPDHVVFRIVPHSCGSRFCTICSSFRTMLWVNDKTEFLTSINTPYCFLTFTLPGAISRLAQKNKEILLDEVFYAVSQALLGWCQKEKNFKPGIVMIMQTSGDRLNYHVHIHLLITCGGLREEKEEWFELKPTRRTAPRNGKKFHPAFPPQVIAKRFKTFINRALRRAYRTEDFNLPEEYAVAAATYKDFNRLLDKWWQVNWNLDISDPLNNTKEIIGYIARYIKKPPISNRRIIEYDEKIVKFIAKDRKDKRKNEIIVLPAEYFVMLLLEHVPLDGFRLIRWYGIFANRNKKHLMPIAQKLIPPLKPTATPKEKNEKAVAVWRKMHKEHFGVDPLVCPICGKEMVLVAVFFPKQLTSLGLSFESVPQFLMN